MKLNNLFLLGILFLLGSCKAYKKKLIQKGGNREVLQNAILDFSNTSNLYKKDSVFSVWIHDPLYKMVLNETSDENSEWINGKPYLGMIAVSISADYNNILLTDTIKIGYKGLKIPTRYIEKDNKLFYWRDADYPLTQETLTIYKKYHLLVDNDLDGVIEFFDLKINDAQKGVHYYFCEKDITNYKKITTNKAIGYYNAPILDCGSLSE